MAYFQYLSEVNTDCLISSFKHILEEVGLNISQEFSSHAQVFAEGINSKQSYQSKVNVLISWNDKSKNECSIEVRSNEPYKKGTSCEKIADELLTLIPPKQSRNSQEP